MYFDLLNYVLLVRADQRVPVLRIGGLSMGGWHVIILKARLWTTVGDVFGKCHTPCALNFENEQTHCSRYKRLTVSSPPKISIFFQWQSKVVDPVDPSVHSFLYTFVYIFFILQNLFSFLIQLKYCSLDVKQSLISQSNRFVQRLQHGMEISSQYNIP